MNGGASDRAFVDAKNLVTTHVRQPNVAEHEVGRKLGHPVYGFLTGVPPNGAPTLELERPLERLAHNRIVVDDRDASRLIQHGSPPREQGPVSAPS